MRPQVLLAVLAVVTDVATALPRAHNQGATLCYDKCGICTRSCPPQCRCMDVALTGILPQGTPKAEITFLQDN
ncbi:Bowman-Birk trypsin inhibitor-like protein [Hordeum vulgare]|nr:Bowman-Birk trypsin inhibitor-like protein [Hordeum vulgare]